MADFSHSKTVAEYRKAYSRYPHVGPRPPVKTASRAVQRQVEFEAGKQESLLARNRRLKAAKIRLEKTGSTIPSKPNAPRGAEKVFNRSEKNPFKITVGHVGPRAFLKGFDFSGAESELTKEGSTAIQSKKSNYGKSGQGAATIPEWKRKLRKQGLGVFPDNPIELDTNKTRVQKRQTKTYGPAPRVGRAAGFTGRLPVVTSPANLLMEFLMANKENRPMDPFKALTGLSMSGPPGYGGDPSRYMG
jgi:hypothetical protein